MCPAVTPGEAVPVVTVKVTGEPEEVPAADVGRAAVANPESVAVNPPVELM